MKVGVASLTEACLNDPKVRREIGDAQDNKNLLMLQVQEANDHATFALRCLGFDPALLKSKIAVKKEDNESVTVANTRERVETLGRAKTHGQKFKATGVANITSNDFFKSLEVAERDNKIAALQKRLAEAEMKLLKANGGVVQVVSKEPSDVDESEKEEVSEVSEKAAEEPEEEVAEQPKSSLARAAASGIDKQLMDDSLENLVHFEQEKLFTDGPKL